VLLPALAKLTEVVRQTGPLLDFCLDVRNAKYDYKEVHLEHYGRSEAVQILSFNEALLKTADRINRGEDAVVIVGTNARVAQVNALIRYILKGDGKITLEVGDQMISHGVLSRGKNGECNAFGEQPFFPTRKKMRITSIIGEDTYTNPWTGNTFRVFEVTAEELSGVDIGTTIKIVDPDQFLAWQEERKAQREKVFLQTLSTTANSPRGKMGDGAKAIWQRVFYQNNPEICMASWEFWSKPGQPTHKDKKNRITRRSHRCTAGGVRRCSGRNCGPSYVQLRGNDPFNPGGHGGIPLYRHGNRLPPADPGLAATLVRANRASRAGTGR
jgi:hypothetical protein